VCVFLTCCSAYEGDIADFELGDEVEFSVSQKNGKVSAENLRRVIRGRFPTEVKAMTG